MKPGKIDWGAKTAPSRQLMKYLPAIRGVREVAKIMGVSRGTVFYAEKSALNKIVKEMRSFCIYEKTD
jgi:hypothetical protein